MQKWNSPKKKLAVLWVDSVPTKNTRMSPAIATQIRSWLRLELRPTSDFSSAGAGRISGERVLKIHGEQRFEIGKRWFVVRKWQFILPWMLCLTVLASTFVTALEREHVLLGAAGQAVEGIVAELQRGESGDIMPYVTALEFILATVGKGLGMDDAATREEASSILPAVFVRLSEGLLAHEDLWKVGGARQAEMAAAVVLLGETAVPVARQASDDSAPAVKFAGMTAAGEVLRLLHHVGASGESAGILVQSMRDILEQSEADDDSLVSQTATAGSEPVTPPGQLTPEELTIQKDFYEAKLHEFLDEPLGGFYSSDITEFEHYHSNQTFREFVDHLLALGYGIEQAEGYYYLYVGEPANYKDGEMD